METKTIKSYKGFNSDLSCRGFQYEIGKDYEQSGKIRACEAGFHACENPLDVLDYYPPCDEAGNIRRYCEVEQSGEIYREADKLCSSKIHIAAEIGLSGLINAGVRFILNKINWKDDTATNSGDYSAATNTGDYSAATNTGDCSAATNTGNRSAATNTGDYSAATNSGDYSAATNTGYCSAATNTGDCSAATNTGNRSAATNTGNYSAATNTGNYSAATNTGYCSAATNTGDCSAATNTGNRSAATNTGNYSAATNSGDYSAATNTGDCSAASVEGADSIAIVAGYKGKAKGALGCWLVLTERDDEMHILDVKAVLVDGAAIKPDTWYELRDGKVTEVTPTDK